MAWQSLSGMGSGGNGGNGPVDAAQQQANQQPQGTEYTLQGAFTKSNEGWIRGNADSL